MQVKDNGTDFEAIPTGNQPAVCSGIFDLGMQPAFNKQQHQVAFVWELNVVRKEGDYMGQRFKVTKKYHATLNERSNLSRDLEGWRGKAFTEQERLGFDLDVFKRKNCNLNMVEKPTKKGGTWTEPVSISGLQKGQSRMVPEQPDFIPPWIAELISSAGSSGDNDDSGTHAPDFDDPIPF